MPDIRRKIGWKILAKDALDAGEKICNAGIRRTTGGKISVKNALDADEKICNAGFQIKTGKNFQIAYNFCIRS